MNFTTPVFYHHHCKEVYFLIQTTLNECSYIATNIFNKLVENKLLYFTDGISKIAKCTHSIKPIWWRFPVLHLRYKHPHQRKLWVCQGRIMYLNRAIYNEHHLERQRSTLRTRTQLDRNAVPICHNSILYG